MVYCSRQERKIFNFLDFAQFSTFSLRNFSPKMTENQGSSSESSSSIENLTENRENSATAAPDAKRQRCLREENHENSTTFDEDSSCSICFEPYTNGGSHRLSCLKCGHLFGCSCIKKWLGRGSTRRNYCPQCKTPAKLADVRNHYCKGVKVLDTSEKDALHKSLELERENKRQLMIELATLKQKCDSLQREMGKMKLDFERNRDSKLTTLKSNDVSYSTIATSSSNNKNDKKCKVSFLRKMEICREGESRVMAFCKPMDLLTVSARQNTALFNHCGLKKIDMHNLRCTDFIPLHNEVIRDVKFSENFTALTSSFDKMLCLSSLHNNCVMQRWNLGHRVWSCCFKQDQPCYIFAATQNGRVVMFDSRMSHQQQNDESSSSSQNEIVELINLQKPIFNLHWVKNLNNSNTSGLLISSVDKCVFMSQNSPTNFTPHILPSEGRHYSTSYCNDHVMLSYGPSNLRSTTEHSVSCLAKSSSADLSFTLNQVSTLKAGVKQTLMCRNLLTKHPNDETQLLAYTYEECLNTVQIWNASGNGGMLEQVNLQRNETVYDMNSFQCNDRQYFVTLNNKFLSLYTMDFL